MINKLTDWAKANESELKKLGIKTIGIYNNEAGCYVDHESNICIGRISVNVFGDIEIEVYQINPGAKTLYVYLPRQTDFPVELFSLYTKALQANINFDN